MNKVENLLNDKALKRGGISLYRKADALQFVFACKSLNIVILGIDGFFITQDTTQPSMENSIDYSRRPFGDSIYDEAIQFLKTKDDDMYFEIVCSD